jgi:hypothetical protein
MRLPPRPGPIVHPILKPGPVKTIGAFVFRLVRKRPGWTLYIALLLPWLLGSKDPAWADVAQIMLFLAIPLFILSHSRIGGFIVGPFIFLRDRNGNRR